jgi:serine/threonine protein kinase
MSEIEEAFDEKTRRQDPSTIRQRSRARTSRNRPQHRPVTGSSKSRAFSDQSILLNPEQWESIKEKELFQAGTIIQDNYRLEEKIGEGSMGVVWKAADLIQEAGDSRDVYVAIKFLTKDFKRHPNALIKALVREIARYKRLTHSNIVKAYKLSRVGDIIFIVMEFLDGIPLEEFIKQHPNGIPLSQAEPIIRGMGEALAYAHQQGITHLDFKPANVFYDPNKGVTKVMDFSIAQFIEVSDREKTRFKVSELRTPTKAYASCEMLAELVPTPQDDIYALACVTYELLSGKHPFDKTRADQVRLSKELFPPKPIKGLKNKQYKALLRALAFERENRTPTVEEFFEEFFLSKPIVKKSRLAMAAGGIFILLSLAVFVAFSGINQDSSLIECLLLSDEACIKELEPNNLLIDCHPDNRRDLKVSKDPSYCRDDKPGNYFVPSPKAKPSVSLVEEKVQAANSDDIDARPEEENGEEHLTEQDKAKIAQLLRECQERLNADRLVTARQGKTALVCYREVLEIDSDNAEALEGLKAIEQRYKELAEGALDKNRFDSVKKYLDRLETVNPKSPVLADLRRRLEQAEAVHFN